MQRRAYWGDYSSGGSGEKQLQASEGFAKHNVQFRFPPETDSIIVWNFFSSVQGQTSSRLKKLTPSIHWLIKQTRLSAMKNYNNVCH